MKANHSEWQQVFWVACMVLTITCIIYIIWASSDPQPFNDPQYLIERKARIQAEKEAKEKEKAAKKTATAAK